MEGRKANTVKPVFSGRSKRRPKFGFQYQISLNAGQKYCRMLKREHSAILLTFIKLPFAIKTFDLSIFELLLKAGFSVYEMIFSVTLSQPRLSRKLLQKQLHLNYEMTRHDSFIHVGNVAS